MHELNAISKGVQLAAVVFEHGRQLLQSTSETMR